MNIKRLTSTENPPAILSQRPCVLVVDDDQLIRRINSEMLLGAGYDVDVAEDGSEAWDALQVHSYDLLVTDNQMPNVSGVELVRKIHAASMELPVIMATGTLPGEGLKRQPWFQPVITLLKPYTHAEFLGTVEAVMRATMNGCQLTNLVPNWESQPLVFGLRLN